MSQALIVARGQSALNNQAVLKNTKAKDSSKALTPEQALLAANFTLAMEEDGAPTPGQIAAACQVSEQAVSNWKRTGKITKGNLRIVSSMTRWSVHRLLTGQPDPPAAPNPGFADKREMTDSDWQLLDDIKDGASEDDLERIRERARWVRAKAEEVIQRRQAPASDHSKE